MTGRREVASGPSGARTRSALRSLGWIGRSFTVATLALGAIALTVAALYVAERRQVRWVQDSRETARLARTARALAADRETAVRGYLLTGDPRSLAPERAARPALAAVLDSLLVRTAGDPAQRSAVERSRAALVRWERGFADDVTRAAPGAARAGERTPLAGQALFDEVRAALLELIGREEALYARRVARQHRLQLASLALVLLELAVVAVALVVMGRRIDGQTVRLVEQQGQLERQASDLEDQAAMLEEQAIELESTNEALAGALADAEHGRESAESASGELRELASLLRAVVDGSPTAIIAVDRDLRVVEWNAAAEQLFGWRRDEILGREYPLVPPERASETERLRDAGLLGRQASGIETERLRKDGTLVPVSVSIAPLRVDEGEASGAVVLCTDLSEQRRLEAQLRQSQKMEAIGLLAGGVAHDFNNVLTAIRSYSELLLLDDGLSPVLREDVTQIQKAAERAATLTRQLLAFSRRQVLQPQVLDVNPVVADIERMLRRLTVGHIDLHIVLSPEPALIAVDPGQLEQVLMNLVVNARDAMPDGGRLSIETAVVELDDLYARRNRIAPGRYVMVAVSDTGHGMDEATQARAFDPFFTTKETGKGTGLGLSTVWGIVRQSGGHVWLYSERGHGTTFKLYFPHADAPHAAPDPPGPGPGGGAETVLLVDDEESVRRPIRRLLERLGYTVLEASGGEEALQVAEAHPGPIDVVVTDVVMPGLGGPALVARLRARREGLRVLFTSGYTDDDVFRRGLLQPSDAFLQKPFVLDELAASVRALLDATPRATGAAP